MTVTLMVNGSAPNYIRKSVSTVASFEGVPLEPCSVTKPTIVIEGAPAAGFNYMHIPEFGRYYYVNGISVMPGNMVAVSGNTDPLMSFADEIMSFSGIVRRQSGMYDLYLDDGNFKVRQDSKHKIIAFPNSFKDESYVLVVAGN